MHAWASVLPRDSLLQLDAVFNLRNREVVNAVVGFSCAVLISMCGSQPPLLTAWPTRLGWKGTDDVSAPPNSARWQLLCSFSCSAASHRLHPGRWLRLVWRGIPQLRDQDPKPGQAVRLRSPPGELLRPASVLPVQEPAPDRAVPGESRGSTDGVVGAATGSVGSYCNCRPSTAQNMTLRSTTSYQSTCNAVNVALKPASGRRCYLRVQRLVAVKLFKKLNPLNKFTFTWVHLRINVSEDKVKKHLTFDTWLFCNIIILNPM